MERSPTPVRGKGAKDKQSTRTNKTNTVKDKMKQNKTGTLINESMPNWTLQIVSDADLAVKCFRLLCKISPIFRYEYNLMLNEYSKFESSIIL